MNTSFFNRLASLLLCLPALGVLSPALAQAAPPAVKVEQAWVRPSVPGQQGTGGYMKLTARDGQRLVGASSPVAGVAEIHEMKMEGDVMKMRPAGALELPAGKTVELKPGGLHLMLMDLKQPLVAGRSVPVTLLLKDSHGVESRVETQLLVSLTPPDGSASRDARKH
jgi:copper(I)-binding protein